MSNVTCELRPQSVSAHRACNECLVSGGVGHSGFDMLFQAKESEPVNCVTALASWTIATNGRFPGSWSSALGTLRAATNCFFTALNWSAGKPTVAVTCNVSKVEFDPQRIAKQ